ncbi:MAG: hypothetical protein JXL97_10410 [Bacteroidales bacterium]|nr:hypothetical protein [Bacteroidales bacterium]
MKVKIIIILFVFSILSISGFSQNEDKPYPVLPGGSITNTTTDTLWVLNSTKQFKKTIIALNNQKLYKELDRQNKQLIDSLLVLNDIRAEYIDSLKLEYNICMDEATNLYENSELLGELNTKQSKYTRIAIVVGASTTLAAFVVGFILGIK